VLTLPLPRHRRSSTAAPPSVRPHGIAYRPDVDGLRGLAVLSLLAIHCAPGWALGARFGTDVFFVLSGFLVTAQVCRTSALGASSYLVFLQRRVARLVPSAVLVLAACLVFAVLFTSADQARDIGRRVAWASTMLSDLALRREAPPSASSSLLDPVYPFWAVGLVAQFSLLWPAMLVALPGMRAARAMAVAGLGASLAFALTCAVLGSWAAFHPLAGRWWEFMVGAGLALRAVVPPRVEVPYRDVGPWREALPWAGMALLAAVGLLGHEAPVLPDAWAVLPALGAGAVIAAGPAAWLNRRVLAQPLLRFYGVVAYPLALWHWAVLSFIAILGVPLTSDVRALVLIACIVTAALTYELVELPLRAHAQSSPRAALWLLAALAVAGLLGALLVAFDGLPTTYPASGGGVP
jgi:peptidoglycan/LPS O-acetylase OafA/YrhL